MGDDPWDEIWDDSCNGSTLEVAEESSKSGKSAMVAAVSATPRRTVTVYRVSSEASNWLQVDSGAAVSVCPPSWGSRFGSIPVRKDLKLQGAGGDPIRTHGVRRVQLHADQSTSFPMDFVIADVD